MKIREIITAAKVAVELRSYMRIELKEPLDYPRLKGKIIWGWILKVHTLTIDFFASNERVEVVIFIKNIEKIVEDKPIKKGD